MESIVGILIPVTYFALLALERIFPARPLPRVRGWTLRGLVFFVVVMVASGLTPALVATLIGEWSSAHLTRLGTLGGALVAFVATDLLGYVMHRAFHRVGWLWRWVHQLHHAAERLDVLGSTFTHPAEVVVPGIVTTVATVALGVSPDAAALAGFFTVFNAIFQHCNVRTPRWLGYVVQRPESHSIHHARGVHAYNYANLPLIDLLFGTFRNPSDFTKVQGLWDGASAQLGALFTGRDLSHQAAREPADASGSASAASAE